MDKLPDAPGVEDDTRSSFVLEITLSVGYKRRRAVLGGALEGHIVTFALLLGGILFVAGVVYALLRVIRVLPF